MIEVEKDFILSEEAERRLAAVATSVTEKQLRDVYYDTPDFAWTTRDHWLRLRNGVFELKIRTRAQSTGAVSQYQEIENEDDIRKTLRISVQGTLSEDLRTAGFVEVCDCETQRTEYRVGAFVVDVDRASFAGTSFVFQTAEIELMVEHPEDVAEAEKRILEFAPIHGFREPPTQRGKVLSYIAHEKPEHFQALVASGADVF